MYTTANIPKLFRNKSTSSSPTTADRYTIDSLKLMPAIQATRAAYKACGKDPSRYRPSSEALIRRTLRGMELYKVDTLVDAVNLASIAYGYSIGGFDADKIQGDTLTLGIGRAGEPYEGIGRGPLNIEGLPVYRDQIGGIGTPTSDHERTKLSLSSTRLLAVVNGYGGGEFLDDTVTLLQSLLRRVRCLGRRNRTAFLRAEFANFGKKISQLWKRYLKSLLFSNG
jgi:DNA/RNA-binding domain of Phe-tRNA-synthetase-like protein